MIKTRLGTRPENNTAQHGLDFGLDCPPRLGQLVLSCGWRAKHRSANPKYRQLYYKLVHYPELVCVGFPEPAVERIVPPPQQGHQRVAALGLSNQRRSGMEFVRNLERFQGLVPRDIDQGEPQGTAVMDLQQQEPEQTVCQPVPKPAAMSTP